MIVDAEAVPDDSTRMAIIRMLSRRRLPSLEQSRFASTSGQ